MVLLNLGQRFTMHFRILPLSCTAPCCNPAANAILVSTFLRELRTISISGLLLHSRTGVRIQVFHSPLYLNYLHPATFLPESTIRLERRDGTVRPTVTGAIEVRSEPDGLVDFFSSVLIGVHTTLKQILQRASS